ncbi:MAG: DnaJ domain-containing protein [Hyphomicrobiaceae bacterium]
MDRFSALRMAIDLIQIPTRVRHGREAELPHGMEDLLRVAAGQDDVIQDAAAATGRDAEFLKEAAIFFVEQILLAPETDSYRTLGGDRHTSTEELRRNLALLMRCLHPDATHDQSRSVFAGRITSAWEDLKTPERRAIYDAQPSITLNNGKEAIRKRRHRRRGHVRPSSRQRPAGLRDILHRIMGRTY